MRRWNKFSFTFPESKSYHGFWTWDRIVGAFLIAIAGALGFNWFLAGSAIALVWNLGSILFGGAAGLHLLINFYGSHHIKFGIFLFICALLGAFALLGLLVADIQSHT